MKVLLVNSPIHRESQDYDDTLPPLGLWYIATNLKKQGIDVEILDTISKKLSFKDIVNQIESGDFSHVWLNVFSTNHQLVKELVESVSSKEVVFLLWWPYLKTEAIVASKWKTANDLFLVIWEGDFIVSDIVNDSVKESPVFVEKGRKIYRVDKNSIYYPSNLNELDLDRSLLHEETFNKLTGQPEANIITSRWCIYNCGFCGAAVSLNLSSSARLRSMDNIEQEIMEIKKTNPQIKSIRILDDLFLRNQKIVREASQMFSRIWLDWRAMAHIQTFKQITSEALHDLQKSWCCELSIGIESWDQEILNKINKPNKIQEIISTITEILKVGISVKWYFIVWFPWETEESMQKTYELAKILKDISSDCVWDFRVSAFQFRPYHGTKLYNILKEGGASLHDISAQKLSSNWVAEFDFSWWNFSQVSDETLLSFLEQIRWLNNQNNFLPYTPTPSLQVPNNWVFFVGLSHKEDKQWNILAAFDKDTNSGEIIHSIFDAFPSESMYPVNLVRWVPNDQNGKLRYPTVKEKGKWWNVLEKEIDLYKPQVVFLCWKEVSDFILKQSDVQKIDEKIYKYKTSKLIPIEHPSYISVYRQKYKHEYIDKIRLLIKKYAH